MPQKIGKEATAILDFTIDLTNLLQTTEIINTSNWTVPTGITQVTTTNDDTMATIWLSGGTLNAVYELRMFEMTDGQIPSIFETV